MTSTTTYRAAEGAPVAHDLDTEIEIDAPAEAVWAILTDLASSPAWNPSITAAQGAIAVGERLVVQLEPPRGRRIALEPIVTEVDPGRSVESLGRLAVPGAFDGRHRFELVPDGDVTRLIQMEHVTGVLVPLLEHSLDTATLAGFDAMNAALKARAEAAHRAAGAR